MSMQESEQGTVTNLLANERTFLAWVRTSLGVMAFGFVVEKFELFLRRISVLIGEKGTLPYSIPETSLPGGSLSMFGIYIIAFGALVCLFAFWRYRNVERQLKNKAYQPSQLLNDLLAGGVFMIGVLLIFYLIGLI